MNNLFTAATSVALLTAAPITASAATEATNMVSGLVVPFNELGDTSQGRLSVKPGAITLPEDLGEVKLFRDHSNAGGAPVGYATAAEIKDDGIYMSFHVANTSDGQAAMDDVRARVRDALSVELREFETNGDVIVAASLSAVALVAVPAYARARVEPSKASTLASSMTHPALTASNNDQPINLTHVSKALMATASGHDLDTLLTAALKNVKATTSQASTQAQWLGELWDGGTYARRIIPTLTTRTLTSDKMKGWKWVKRPIITDYAGNLEAISSNELEIKDVEVTASRLAAGHKFDRKHIDFHDSDFMSSYLSAMRDSYARQSDAKAGAFIVTEAAKRSKSAVLNAKSMLEAMAIANETIEDDLEVTPTTYLVNPADRRALIEITNDTAPAYLDLLGIDPHKLVPYKGVTKGTLIAYAKPAITYGELGSTPIRVNALDVANGGSDEAMFGYYALMVNDDRGLCQVKFGV